MIDSPGFGNTTDIRLWLQDITDELLNRMREYKEAMEFVDANKDWEEDFQRKRREKEKVEDRRVHVFFYFFDG